MNRTVENTRPVSYSRPVPSSETPAVPPPDPQDLVTLERTDPRVQKAAGDLMSIAYKADDAYTHAIEREPVAKYVNAIRDRSLLRSLKQGFDEARERELQSTYRSGSMAGALCNMMRIYVTITSCIDERLEGKKPLPQ